MNTQKPVLQTTTAFYYRIKDCNWKFEKTDAEYVLQKYGVGLAVFDIIKISALVLACEMQKPIEKRQIFCSCVEGVPGSYSTYNFLVCPGCVEQAQFGKALLTLWGYRPLFPFCCKKIIENREFINSFLTEAQLPEKHSIVCDCHCEFELIDWENSDGELSENTQKALNKTHDYFESFYPELDLYDKNWGCMQ